MDRFIIEGGVPLNGRVRISGSKNSALPILCTAILADSPCRFHNVPRLRDINTMIEVLSILGLKASWSAENSVLVNGGQVTSFEAPYDLVKSMRASILVLGPLLARYGKAQVSLPGGCAIGVRPIDLHLRALQKMGAEIELSHGYVVARANGLTGARIVFDKVTVGGTENIMMAATLAKGTTVIEGAAREPEITDLARTLTAMGARIEGAGTDEITIEGVETLHGVEHTVIPDRIEAGTFMVAAPITRGHLEIEGARIKHMAAIVAKLEEMGVKVREEGDLLVVDGDVDLRPVELDTAPYPLFPTDMQAQFMALACVAGGVSSITENIFENRFMHVPEFMRMGAVIEEKGHTVIVRGVDRFEGASVMATDLRASAGLVLAALNASGTTEIRRIYHLDRGYDKLDGKLNALGARVRREKGEL